MRAICFLLLLAVTLCVSHVSGQWCLDEDGQPIDWYIIVKVPRLSDSSDPGVSTGTAYLYADAKSYLTPSQFWSNSTHQITDTDSAAGRTLQQIYDNASKTSTNGYVMYNDETPSGTTSETYGHSKGMLAWSASSAFWLIHSVPKYADSPDNVSEYVYPSTGEEYGQTMLCLSLDIANIDQAFLQLQYTNPQVYGSQWVSSLTSQMPNGNAFVNSGTVDMDATSNIVNITTMGGMQLMHFAKTVAWGKSIYGDLIGSYYGESMVVETWQRPYEDPLLPPETSVAVYSVLDLQAPPYATWDGITWKESQDHAKWGIVTDRSVPVICIGDINKQVSQWKRSGGMACMTDATIHQNFVLLIVDTDENNGTKPTTSEPVVASPLIALE
jgi:deoxyribonuclease-2